MKSKKKFKDSVVGKVLIAASSLVPGVGPALSEVLQGSQTPLEAIKLIGDSQATPEDKHRLTEILLKADAEEQQNVTRRWEADATSDSWLSKNVRPLTLVFFSLIYGIGWFNGDDVTQLNGLMMLIVGGYFGARATEKVYQMKQKQ
ncbi:MAG: hypothetical protein K0U41_10045 [Gammaproteobacteria bacterium]|nr:hypothetical protein [Gammaproteobacteria bacterium]